MANKLKVYKFEDTKTGQTVQFEGPEDATDAEIDYFLQQNYMNDPTPPAQPQQEQVVPQTAPQAQTPEVVPQQQAPQQPQQAPELQRQEVQTNIVWGGVDEAEKQDPRWLGAEREAQYAAMLRDPQYSFEDINEWTRQQLKADGRIVPAVAIGGGQAMLDKYREDLAALEAQGLTAADGVVYEDPMKQYALPPVETGKDGKALDDGWLAQFERGYQDAVQHGTAGWMARTYHDWMDTGKEAIRQQYPDATEEQIEEIHENVIASVQKQLRQRNAQLTKDDNIVPWLAAQVAGSAGIEDFVPGMTAAKAATRIRNAAGINTIADLGYQAIDIHDGVQEKFDPVQASLAPVLGATFQGGMEGISASVRGIASRIRGSDDVEAASTPNATETIRVPRNKKGSQQYKVQINEAASDIAGHINRTTQNWEGAPEVQVMRNFRDLKGIKPDAVGVYLGDGRVAINTEALLKEAKRLKIEPEAVVDAVTFHEALGHKGLADEWGDNLDAAMDWMYEGNTGKFRDAVDQWMAENPSAYANDPNPRARAAEEVLAGWSEEGQLPVKFVDRLINDIKDFARRMGLDLRVSDREVRAMLALAQSNVGERQRFGRRPTNRNYTESTPRYMYLGETAKTADTAKLNEIQEQIDFDIMSGVSRDDVMSDYKPENASQNGGWFIGPDGGWRFEIDDSTVAWPVFSEGDPYGTSNFFDELSQEMGLPRSEVANDLEGKSPWEVMGDQKLKDKYPVFNQARLGDVFEHPALMEAYPQLGDIIVTRDVPLRSGIQGSWNPATRTINISPKADNPESTLIHEIQHIVQDIEGFASGGGTNNRAIDAMSDDLVVTAAKNQIAWLDRQIKSMKATVDAIVQLSKDPRFDELHKLEERKYKLLDVIGDAETKLKKYLAKHPGLEQNQFIFASKNRDHPLVKALSKARDEHSKATNDVRALEAEVIQDKFGLTRDEVYANDDRAAEWFDIARVLTGRTNQYNGTPSVRIRKKIKELGKVEGRRKSWQRVVDNEDTNGIRMLLKNDGDAKWDAYQHLFGEVEARDTQMRYEDGLGPVDRDTFTPYTSEARTINPDHYIFDMPEGKNPDLSYSADAEARNMMPKRLEDVEGDGELDIGEQFEVEVAQKVLNDALSGYTPEKKGWAEARAEARALGLNSGHIRKSKGVGELQRRIFQYDQVSQAMSERVAELGAKVMSGQYTMKDKADYLELTFKFNEVVGRIFDDQAEIARALNAMKAVQTTRRRYGEMSRILKEYDNGNAISAFADEDVFQDFARYMQQMVENGNVVGAATAARQVLKPYWWQYILTFRHAMMLSGLATHAKNAMDNATMIAREFEESLLASAADPFRKALRGLGVDAADGVSMQEVAARFYGILRAALDGQTYLGAAKAFKEGHGSTQYSAKIEMQDARIPVVSKVNDALFASDTFFRSFHKNANLYALGVRQARAEGLKGKDLFEEGSARAADPTEDMIDAAQKKADEALLVDTPSGIIAKLESLKAVRPNMKAADQVIAFSANMLMPFFRVTDRLLFQAIRRSPLAFMDKNTRAAFKAGGAERDIAIARAAYGTALMAYYWMQAGDKEGGVVGETTRDYQKLQALEAGGFKQNAVREDGQYVDATALNLSLDPLDTQNNVAANVASIREAWEKGHADEEQTADALAMSAKAMLTMLASQSYAENLSGYIAPVTARSETEENTAWANFVGGTASQFTPAIARQANQQFIDPVKRDTRGDKSFGDRVYGRVASGVPGLSQTLPAKYDAYGDVQEHGRSTFGMNNAVDIKTDEVSTELQKLERTTDKPVVTMFRGSFTHEGETIKLPAEAIQEWNRVQGYYLRSYMEQEIADPRWASSTNEERIKIVKDARKDAYEATKEYMIPMIALPNKEEE